jgi:hypothetical protein
MPSEPFAAVYEDRNRLGVIVARFEAYATDDHCLGLFPTPHEAAAAITMARPWVAQMTPQYTARTALATVPPTLLARVDEVIE